MNPQDAHVLACACRTCLGCSAHYFDRQSRVHQQLPYTVLSTVCRLMKAGFIPKTHEKQVSKFSAYAEACGYAANILLNLYKVQQLKQQERKIWHEILISQKVCRGLWTLCMCKDGCKLSFHGHASRLCVHVNILHRAYGGRSVATFSASLFTFSCHCVMVPPLQQPDAAQRCIDPEALKQLRFLQTARLMRVAFIIQDLSDSLLALNDITGAFLT